MNKTSTISIIIAALAIGTYFGKYNSKIIPPWEPQRSQTTEKSADYVVHAQGRIIPHGDIYSVYAPQGQTVTEFFKNSQGDRFDVGVKVKLGEELVTLAGQKLLKDQITFATAKSKDAITEIEATVVASELNLRAAKLALQQAQLTLTQVQSQKDQSINKKKLANAKSRLERVEKLAADPSTKNLISTQDLFDQRIAVENAQLELDSAIKNLEEGEKAAVFAVESATENVEAAQAALDRAKEAVKNPPDSLNAAKKLALTQYEMSRILSPTDGEILKVFVKAGESVVNTPILQIGNLEQMDCIAEVSERLVGKLNIGKVVKITSPAFDGQDLSGKIIKINRLVGNSSLAIPNPMAMVDKKTVEVEIQIDDTDIEIAQRFINLQVDVAISLSQPAKELDSQE